MDIQNISEIVKFNQELELWKNAYKNLKAILNRMNMAIHPNN